MTDPEQSPLYDTFEFPDYLNQEVASANLTVFNQFNPVTTDPAVYVTPTKGTVSDDEKTYVRSWEVVYHSTIKNDQAWYTDTQSQVDALYDAIYAAHDGNRRFTFQGWDMAISDGTLIVTFNVETIA